MPRRAKLGGRWHARGWQIKTGEWRFSLAWREQGRYRHSVPAPTATTLAEAKALADELNRIQETRSIDDALDDYERYLAVKGNRPGSIATTMHRLRGFFSDQRDAILVGTTKRDVSALYRAACDRWAVDTHRNALNQARTFFSWCVKQGWIDSNPAADVEGVGRRRAGKGQLTADESRKLVAACVDRSASDGGAMATLLALLLGLRASEVVGLRVRDLDSGGAVLWVRGTKTAAARRRLDVPELLQGGLHVLARQRGGRSEPVDGNRRLFPRSRHWVRESVKRMCRLAGVPVVTAHGLRGTHATLATQAGASSMLVAQSIGHAGTAVTERHYIAEGAVEAQRQRRVLRVLAGGKK